MTLEIQPSYSLAGLNTLGLDVLAAYFVRVCSVADLRSALEAARAHDWPVTLLGGGSNIVLTQDLPGLTVQLALGGVEINDEHVTAGAGENWHDLVMQTIDAGLSGLENLALIPGSVGAAPIQNIGAYGAELSDTFESLDAIDLTSLREVTLSREACRFGYRDSLFKGEGRDRYAITRVHLRLSAQFVPNLGYRDLSERLSGKEALTPARVADEVCRIRREKLPDPSLIPNVGSFFKNPVVTAPVLAAMLERWPDLPHWHQESGAKIAAAWLIDQCGLRGEQEGGAAVYDRHALVIINRGHATPGDVERLSLRVRNEVKARFDIDLDIEPRVLPGR